MRDRCIANLERGGAPPQKKSLCNEQKKPNSLGNKWIKLNKCMRRAWGITPHYMESGSSLPQSQEPATCPCPEPDPSLASPFYFLNIRFNIIISSIPSCYKWSLSLRSPHQNSLCISSLPIRATCPAHLIILNFISQEVFGEKQTWYSRSWNRYTRLEILAILSHQAVCWPHSLRTASTSCRGVWELPVTFRTWECYLNSSQ
jgi:hypothetical protein